MELSRWTVSRWRVIRLLGVYVEARRLGFHIWAAWRAASRTH
jgi:hypothetical protein